MKHPFTNVTYKVLSTLSFLLFINLTNTAQICPQNVTPASGPYYSIELTSQTDNINNLFFKGLGNSDFLFKSGVVSSVDLTPASNSWDEFQILTKDDQGNIFFTARQNNKASLFKVEGEQVIDLTPSQSNFKFIYDGFNDGNGSIFFLIDKELTDNLYRYHNGVLEEITFGNFSPNILGYLGQDGSGIKYFRTSIPGDVRLYSFDGAIANDITPAGHDLFQIEDIGTDNSGAFYFDNTNTLGETSLYKVNNGIVTDVTPTGTWITFYLVKKLDGGPLFIAGREQSSGVSLFKIDNGTSTKFQPDGINWSSTRFIHQNSNGSAYFAFNNSTFKSRLYYYNGSTLELLNLGAGSSIEISFLTASNNGKFYLRKTVGNGIFRLFQIDGTSVTDISPLGTTWRSINAEIDKTNPNGVIIETFNSSFSPSIHLYDGSSHTNITPPGTWFGEGRAFQNTTGHIYFVLFNNSSAKAFRYSNGVTTDITLNGPNWESGGGIGIDQMGNFYYTLFSLSLKERVIRATGTMSQDVTPAGGPWREVRNFGKGPYNDYYMGFVNNDYDQLVYRYTNDNCICNPPTPTANCLPSLTKVLDNDEIASLNVLEINNGTNFCYVDYAIDNQSTLFFNCEDVGITNVTLTVTDKISGESSTCNTSLTVKEEEAPTAVCENNTITLDPYGNYELLDNDVLDLLQSEDNCSFTASLSPNDLDCNDLDQVIPVMVTLKDPSGNETSCVSQITVQQGTELPYEWSTQGINVPNGNADYRPCDGQSGEFTLSSTGPSFGGTDKIQFVHQSLCGDGEITAKITDITNSGWAGIMFRESLAAGAKKVTLKTQLSTFIRREIRQFTNGFTQTKQIFKPNTTWLRIERSGLVFRGFSSVDGQNWSLVFYTFLQMNQCVEVGIFAEGINQALLADATFDQVNISNNGGNLAQLPNHIQALNSTDATDVAISLYPNPSSEKIHLDFRQIPELPMNFVIRDNTGQQVYQQQSLLNENNIAFDIDQLPSGIYYIEVYSKTKNYAVLPFIKQ